MKKRGSKFIITFVALIISLAVATGTTFAWFTTNRDVSVDYFEVNASTGSANLSVAANAAGEYSRSKVAFTRAVDLSRTPIRNDAMPDKTEYLDFVGDIRLDALTLSDAGGSLAFYDANNNVVTYNDYSPESQGKVNDDGLGKDYHRFIQFTLHFKGDRAMGVFLSSSSISDVETDLRKVTAAKEAPADFYGDHDAIHVGDKIPAKASNAARVAFIPVDMSDEENPQIATSLTDVKVWCPNEAKYGGGEISSDEQAQRSGTALKGYYKNNLARDYYNAITGANKTYAAKEYPHLINLEEALTAEISADNAKIVELNASNDYTATFVVRVWLEGTDGDCFDTILRDKLSVALHFVGDPSRIS